MLPRATSIKKSHAFTTHTTALSNARRSLLPRRAQNLPHATSLAKQTPIRKHIFAQGRRHIRPRIAMRRSNRQLPARESNASTRERRHRHRRCGRVCRKASNAPKCSGQSTNAHRKQSAHRGITTQRVTILFDRRVAAQRAVPIGRRRVLTSRGNSHEKHES